MTRAALIRALVEAAEPILFSLVIVAALPALLVAGVYFAIETSARDALCPPPDPLAHQPLLTCTRCGKQEREGLCWWVPDLICDSCFDKR